MRSGQSEPLGRLGLALGSAKVGIKVSDAPTSPRALQKMDTMLIKIESNDINCFQSKTCSLKACKDGGMGSCVLSGETTANRALRIVRLTAWLDYACGILFDRQA